MIVRLITWNTAHRFRKAREQAAALRERKPDIVALQEVTDATAAVLFEELSQDGLSHHAIASSKKGAARGGATARKYKVALASRYPLARADDRALEVPWSEKSLSMLVDCPGDPVELHTVHVSPGASHGWLMVDFLEAVYEGLAKPADRNRILCGNLNAPQLELPSGEVVTWVQRQRGDGTLATKRTHLGRPAARWDVAERNVLTGLAEFDLADVFRDVNGSDAEAYSWVLRRKEKTVRRRLDHTFASKALQPISCTYVTDFLDRRLSDHAPMETVF